MQHFCWFLLKYIILKAYSCVDLEVWSKLNASVSCVLRQNARGDFDRADWHCGSVSWNAFSHWRYSHTRSRLLSQIISYSDTKVPVLEWNVSVQMWFMCASWYFYSILQGQQSVLTPNFTTKIRKINLVPKSNWVACNWSSFVLFSFFFSSSNPWLIFFTQNF